MVVTQEELEKIHKAKQILQGTSAFVVWPTTDIDVAWRLGKFLDKQKDSYLRQHVRFAEASEHGKDCGYSQTALRAYFQVEHDKVYNQLREIFNV